MQKALNSLAISILIPSYNSIKYIEECLQSVIKQTFSDIEILCIDANSNDGTLEFLVEMQKKDERIKVIVSDKKSLGYQINLGLKEAKGRYFSIVESDDYARLDMYEKLYNLALKYNCDMVKADIVKFARIKKQKNIHTLICNKKSFYGKLLGNSEKKELIKYSWNMNQSAIYKLDFIRKFGIKANESEGASFQDTGLWFLMMGLADSFYLHNEGLYFYRLDNENSSTKSKEKVYAICDEFRFIDDFLSRYHQIKSELFQAFLYRKFKAYLWNFKRIGHDAKLEFIRHFALEFKPFADKIDASFFSNGERKELKKIIDDPDGFYRDYNSVSFKIRKKGAKIRNRLKAFLKNFL